MNEQCYCDRDRSDNRQSAHHERNVKACSRCRILCSGYNSGESATRRCVFVYDEITNPLAPYRNPVALDVARDLDSKIESLLQESAI